MKKTQNEKLQKLASLRRQAEASVEETKTENTSTTTITDKKEPLMRTSITLRNNDQEAIQKILAFFLQKGFKQISTSTIIQIALQSVSESLAEFSQNVINTYKNVINVDGRRN